jgi:hypothetical protein
MVRAHGVRIVNLSSLKKVCIKLNLTFPSCRHGGMTSPEAGEEAIVDLKGYTLNISIADSDAGKNERSFKGEEPRLP